MLITDVARPREPSGTSRIDRLRSVGNSTDVPVAARASPTRARGRDAAEASSSVPPAAAIAPPTSSGASGMSVEAPTVNRVTAAKTANVAGARAASPTEAPSSSSRNTALQLWWAFSAANPSAPTSPMATRGQARDPPSPRGVEPGTPTRAPIGPSPDTSTLTPAAAITAPATPNTSTASAPEARSAPAPRLPSTTEAEKTPCASVMTRRVDRASSRAARAFAATSDAPEVAPTRSMPRATDARSRPCHAMTMPAPASITSRTPVTRTPNRSTALPVNSIAGSAPTPTHSSAPPSCASVRAAASRSAGSDAPHVPQKTPKAAKATYGPRRWRICVSLHN
ncbi:hypothetical protein BFL35_08390 [Clavibacter michiganensis]|nr:hypothetical protein BFL35_08390 [Clavibacter michiganensis]